MEQDKLPPGFSRETTIRRDRLGRWFQDDIEVANPQVSQAFNRWLERDENGRFRLRNSIHWVYVEIEGSPLFVRSIHRTEPGPWLLRLSNERESILEPNTLRVDHEGRVSCFVADQNMSAEFESHALVQLQDCLVEDTAGIYFQNHDGHKFYLQQSDLQRTE